MNDEIKEILDNMKEISSFEYTTDWFELNFEDTKILLNYITNLQNRIKELEEINKQHQEINVELRAENKRLKLYLDKLFMVIKEMSEMIK